MTVTMQTDIRDTIFASIAEKRIMADIICEGIGVICGIKRLNEALASLGVQAVLHKDEGDNVQPGEVIGSITGTPKQIAVAEEFVVGLLAKPSGIASAAYQAVQAAQGKLNIISGAWKKMPPEIKWVVREAVACGGASFRIINQPFLYLDKNFIRMFGGIETTLLAVEDIAGHLKVVQLKGDFDDIALEALTAVLHGADVVMVDTGNIADAERVHGILTEQGVRSKVKLAFAKGIKIDNIGQLLNKGIDILDIGASIIDAPLLDMKLDVCKGG